MQIKTTILFLSLLASQLIKAQEKITFIVNTDTVIVELIETFDQNGSADNSVYFNGRYEVELTLTNLSGDTLMIPPANANTDHVLTHIPPLNGWEVYSSVINCYIAVPQDQILLPGQTGKVLLKIDWGFFRKRGSKVVYLEPMVYKKGDDDRKLIPVKKQKIIVITK